MPPARYALLLVFQAMDAAGKDGAIKHVLSGLNPQGCEVFSFKKPSAQDLAHDFLWRTTVCLPERGRIGIFNRSYYEEVLVVRVHPQILGRGTIPVELIDAEKIWEQRYRSILNLEEHLHRNGTQIVKFFLHLSKEEQRKRFLLRIEEPARNWKFSQADIQERAVLEGLHEGLRGLPGRDQQQIRAVAHCSRRRQGKRAAHHFEDHSGNAQRSEDAVPRDEQNAPQGTGGHPQQLANRLVLAGLPACDQF